MHMSLATRGNSVFVSWLADELELDTEYVLHW